MSFPSSENFLGFWFRRKKQWHQNPIVLPHPRWSEEDAQEFSFVLRAEGASHYLLRIADLESQRPWGHVLVPIQMGIEEALRISQRQIREKIVFSRNYKVPIPHSLSHCLLHSFTPAASVVWLDKTAPIPSAPDGAVSWGWNHHRPVKAHQVARRILADIPIHFGRSETVQIVHLDLKSRGIPHQIWEHAQGYSAAKYSGPVPCQISLSGGTPKVILEHPPIGLEGITNE